MAVTWADIIASGRGTVELRLRIEGVEPEFCTEGMTTGLSTGTGANGHVRYHGLRREGLGFSETVYLAGAEHEVRISVVQIDESAGAQRGAATALFSRIARPLDALSATAESADPAISVSDSANVDARYIYAGTETMFGDSAASATSEDVTRGVLSSTAQTHYSQVAPRAMVTVLYDHPTGFTGRRVWLYAHGPGETALADQGTILWRGVIDKEPKEQGGIWSVPIGPRTKLLDAPVGAAAGKPLRLRGAYYPAEGPFVIYLSRHSGANRTDVVTDGTTVSISGHYETRRNFLDALEVALHTNSTIISWGHRFEGREVGAEGDWDLYITQPSTPRYVSIGGGAHTDGMFNTEVVSPATDPDVGRISAGRDRVPPFIPLGTVAGNTTYLLNRYPDSSMWASTRYGIAPRDIRLLPLSNHTDPDYASPASDAAISTSPMQRIYVEDTAGLTTDDSLTITSLVSVFDRTTGGYDTTATEEAAARTQILNVGTVVANDYINLFSGEDPAAWPRAFGAGASQPTLLASVRFTSTAGGTLEDFRLALLSRAPSIANLGKGPWVTSDDLASWADAAEEAAGGASWALRRSYVFGKSVRAKDVITEECKLLGLIPYLDANEKLALRPMTIDTRPPLFEIEATNQVVSDGFGSIDGDDDGLVTVVNVQVGFDPTTAENEGDEFNVTHLEAVARVHAERALEIRPKTNAVGPELTWEDAYQRGLSVTTIFGSRRTFTLRVDVSLVLWPVRVGDPVVVTIPQLPGDGDRGIWTSGAGITARTGIVVSRSWDLERGTGSLGVLLHELAVAGYTPSGWVVDAGGSGTAWVLVLQPGHYSGTASDAQFFTIGDAIRIVEWDSDTPTVREGVVVDVDVGAESVEVAFDTSWAGLGGKRYTLIWDTSSDSETTDEQLASAFVADAATHKISTPTGTIPSKRFAP